MRCCRWRGDSAKGIGPTFRAAGTPWKKRSNDETSQADETIANGSLSSNSAEGLGIDALLPGDILLYRPIFPNLSQRAISAATGSPYTHAAIFIGDGMIAESMPPRGVRSTEVSKSLGKSYVAVFRSQMGFGNNRVSELRDFVDDVVGKRKFYNAIAAAKVPSRSKAYVENSLEFIRENYGKTTSRDEYSELSFFCSAFVVACLAVVGIIGPSAQVAYEPDNFAPGHLNQDPTFGWLLGFLLPANSSVPEDDPILTGSTHWGDIDEARWWDGASTSS